MRPPLIALVLALFISTDAFAQTADKKAALEHSGRVKIWLGAGLAVAGVFVAPLTGAADSRGPIQENARAVGVGLMAAGGTLIYLGALDRRNANSPSSTIGIAVGKVTAIQFRRRW